MRYKKNRKVGRLLTFAIAIFMSLSTLSMISITVRGQPIVDGVISSGEYDGGIAVELVVGTWTVDAYIDWDDHYLYVAVDEPCPTYIEFGFDAGVTRDRFDLFGMFPGSPFYQFCMKSGGGWSGAKPAPPGTAFLAVSNTATEFKFDYTYFGIALGDTIPMCVERGYTPNAYWPEGGKIWTAPGRRPDPSTWGAVTLSPDIVSITIDIKPGSYPNSINPKSKGKIPVAILTTEDFDASTVDPDTVEFLGASPLFLAMDDVDDDGDMDMILHFNTQELDFSLLMDEGDDYPYGYLTGETIDGTEIEGKDTVRIVGRLFEILEQLSNRFPILHQLLGL
jgi:hypothetical protein